MKTLIVNQANLVSSTYNNEFKYTFPAGAVTFEEGDQVAVASVSIYYSWRNVDSSTYGNSTFAYTWVDGTVVNVTIPDGAYYTVSDLNAYLQSQMYSNGHYLYNSTSSKVLYYLELVENSTYYGIQLNAYSVPTELPDSYALPDGATWSLPSSAKTPQFTVKDNFSSLIGFSAGTYPSSPQSSDYYRVSTSTPQISPVSSLVVTCSLVNNKYSLPPQLAFSFAPNVQFGSLITVTPAQLSFLDISPGQYTDFSIKFYDQAFRPIKVQDTNLVVLLTVRNKSEYSLK